jgi:uncharacterized protein YyaL (SSP411 family)
VTELFQATGRVEWLDWARALTEIQTAKFYDARDGGWFSTTGDDPTVLLRLKEDYDGAEPAAASVTVRNLLVLGHLASDTRLVDLAGRTLERYGTSSSASRAATRRVRSNASRPVATGRARSRFRCRRAIAIRRSRRRCRGSPP